MDLWQVAYNICIAFYSFYIGIVFYSSNSFLKMAILVRYLYWVKWSYEDGFPYSCLPKFWKYNLHNVEKHVWGGQEWMFSKAYHGLLKCIFPFSIFVLVANLGKPVLAKIIEFLGKKYFISFWKGKHLHFLYVLDFGQIQAPICKKFAMIFFRLEMIPLPLLEFLQKFIHFCGQRPPPSVIDSHYVC